MSSKQVYLIGAGGHAKQVADVFLDSGYEILGAYDDTKAGIFYRGIPIIGTLTDLDSYSGSMKDEIPLFCTIGDNPTRQRIVNRYPELKWANCISPQAYISPTVTLGKGNYIGVHARLLSETKVGDFNIINDGATLTHDNTLGDFNHIAPNASLGGRVRIGNLNLIGTNATLNPDTMIRDQITIGSGSVVIRPCLQAGTYIGVPSRLSAPLLQKS